MARHNEGFTLVELMIVVVIIGVISTLAVYGIARYLKHSKTAEATRNLGALENGARAQYQRETPYGTGTTDLYVHTFCPAAPLTPSAVPKAAKAKTIPADWNGAGWTCLKFSVVEPVYFSYQHETNSSTGTDAQYTVTANGDLDGNGTMSTFLLRGHGGPLGDAIRDALLAINEDE